MALIKPMTKTYRSHTLSITIARPPAEVVSFLLNPANLSLWMSVGRLSMTPRENGEWLIELPQGPRIVSFEAPNKYGVVDHAFYKEGEAREMTPTRVFPNGEGAELTYTMLQKDGVSDEEFASTVHWVEADLLALKSWLEAG